MKIAYIVHDLGDPAVARRVQMLRAAGGDPVVIGFRRNERVPTDVAGAGVVDLGRTADARLGQRALAVLRNLLRPGRMLAAAADADIVIGRNLEALALAARVRRSLPGAQLIYECLDIHRTLLGTRPTDRAVQAVERALLRGVDLLVISSPAFVRDYFARRSGFTAPALLVENKVLELEGDAPAVGVPTPPPGPPWTIGWFGNLRCRRTFTFLSYLARRHEGRVQILIAGRPSPAEFPDLAGAVAAVPNMRFIGPYAPGDLPAIYGQCHFAWAIDWFEDGLNSRWLLPNRLYEASSYGAVPIALASVETGRWLAAHDAGVLLDNALGGLDAFFAGLDAAAYARLHGAVTAIPRSALIADQSDCTALMQAIAGR
jgi:succinoglycan biosynthesis protein ExoL